MARLKTKIQEERKSKMTVLAAIMLVLLSAYAFSLFGLIDWGLMTALKSATEYAPKGGTVHDIGMFAPLKEVELHFKEVLQAMKEGASADSFLTYDKVSFWEVLAYSILFAGGCAFFKTLVVCLTAYTCARFNFKSSKIVYATVLVVMMVPIVGSLPSELYVAHTLKIHDKIWGLWIMRSNFLGLYFLVMYNSFKAIPASFSEAAKVDGANNWQILFRIMMPLIKGTFATVFLIYFVEYWNEYQVPMVYLPTFPTLGYTVFDTINGSLKQTIRSVPEQFTLAFTAILPIVILYLAFQDKLMGNFTIGGVKG